MSNIKLLNTKKQKTHKEYLEDCNQRKYYNQVISKKLLNALQIEEENLQGLSDLDFRYYAEYPDLHKFQRQANNMQKCCNRFFAETWESEKLQDTKRKTKPFQTCKNKLCAICCKIRSNRLFNQTYNVIDYIKENEEIYGSFIPFHFTATIKNPTYSQFGEYYKIMNDAITLLLDKNQKSKVFHLRNFVVGYQIAREVSQSPAAKNDGELHPHLHILLLLSPDFMSKGRRKITEKGVLAEWNYALKAQKADFPDCTQWSFEQIKADKEKSLLDNEANAIAEVSKYPTKPGDMLDMPDSVLLDLLRNLDGARMVTFGGIIKQVRNLLGYSGNIEVVDGFIREDLYKLTGIKLYNFSQGIYKRQNIRKIDLLEYRTISSSELTELTYTKDREAVKARSAGVQQYLDNDFTEINKIKEIAKYKDYENILDSDLAEIGNKVLALAKLDFETGKEIKLMQKYITAILISQFIYYSVL